MKLGLHIGLNSVLPAAYNGWDGELYAAVADARSHAALFAQHGYATRALLNEDATLRKVRAELSGLAAALKADDTLVLTFSGHGSRAPGWIFASYREALCFYDGQFSDQELRAALTTFAPGSRVVVILDCCYSGGMDRGMVSREGAKGAKVCPRFISEHITPPAEAAPAARGSIAAAALLLTACRADETALDGWVNGAFTGSQLRAREEFPNDRVPTWAAWHEATSSLMLKEHAPQHPQAIPLGAPGIFTQRINA